MKATPRQNRRVEWLVRQAWRELNQATDTTDSSLARSHLDGCLNTSVSAARLLHGDVVAGFSQRDVIRFLLRGPAGNQSGGEDALLKIERYLDRNEADGTYPSGAVSHSAGPQDLRWMNEAAIPSAWQLIRVLRAEVIARRSWLNCCADMVKVAGFLAAVWCAGLALTFVQPEGAIVIYYRDSALKQAVGVSVEIDLYKEYKGRSPVLFAGRRNWSASWHGCLRVPREGVYVFDTQSRDGLRFWVDGEMLVDNWREQEWSNSRRHAEVRLSRGSHPFRLDYYSRSGVGAVRVVWSGDGIPQKTVIGSPYLSKY